jgi:hypothetical protein
MCKTTTVSKATRNKFIFPYLLACILRCSWTLTCKVRFYLFRCKLRHRGFNPQSQGFIVHQWFPLCSVNVWCYLWFKRLSPEAVKGVQYLLVTVLSTFYLYLPVGFMLYCPRLVSDLFVLSLTRGSEGCTVPVSYCIVNILLMSSSGVFAVLP